MGLPLYPYRDIQWGTLELRDHAVDLGVVAMMGQVQKGEAKTRNTHFVAPEKRSWPCSFLSNF